MPRVATSRSKIVALPDVGSSRPRRIFRSVLLPAPFDPTSPTIPGSISTVRPSSAVTPPGSAWSGHRSRSSSPAQGTVPGRARGIVTLGLDDGRRDRAPTPRGGAVGARRPGGAGSFPGRLGGRLPVLRGGVFDRSRARVLPGVPDRGREPSVSRPACALRTVPGRCPAARISRAGRIARSGCGPAGHAAHDPRRGVRRRAGPGRPAGLAPGCW